MPVAKNMKELEKMVLGEFKKRIPGVTKEFCLGTAMDISDQKIQLQELSLLQLCVTLQN